MVRLLAICLVTLPFMATSALAESKKDEGCATADRSNTAAIGTDGDDQKGDETGYGSPAKGGGDNDFDAAEKDGCPVDGMKAAPPPDEKRNG